MIHALKTYDGKVATSRCGTEVKRKKPYHSMVGDVQMSAWEHQVECVHCLLGGQP